MAVRQYIGARYVPIFDGAWDNTKAYEPLTVVEYQGNSYTSRQAVPVGIAITNEQYWVQTGNYSAQIEAYRQEVFNYNNRITDLENKFPVTATDITDNAIRTRHISDGNVTESKIANGSVTFPKLATAVQTRITNLESEISDLNSKASFYGYFNGHGALFIGDSYTYGTGASDHLSGNTKRFSSLLATRLGATEYNYAVSSTGFCDPGSSGQNAPFETQVLTAANALDSLVRNDIHLVVIAGGFNDWNEGATYGADAMQAAASRAARNARTYFPNALILVVPMLFKGFDANARLWNFENAIISGVGGLNGGERTVYIRGAWTWNWGMASHYANDGFHPNDIGHATIASQIYANLLGGTVFENRLEIIQFAEDFNSSVNDGGYMQFYNGMIVSQGMRCTTVKGFEANTNVIIGKVPDGCVPLQNISMPLMRSNALHGTILITNSGNIYVRSDVAFPANADIYMNAFSYLPKGIRTS